MILGRLTSIVLFLKTSKILTIRQCERFDEDFSSHNQMSPNVRSVLKLVLPHGPHSHDIFTLYPTQSNPSERTLIGDLFGTKLVVSHQQFHVKNLFVFPFTSLRLTYLSCGFVFHVPILFLVRSTNILDFLSIKRIQWTHLSPLSLLHLFFFCEQIKKKHFLKLI